MPKSVAGCVGLFAMIVSLAALARAEEPKCKCPEAKVAREIGIPIPGFDRLFKRVIVDDHETEATPEEHAVFQFEIGLAGPAACEACPAGKAAACGTAACGKDGCLVRPIKIAGPAVAASHCAALSHCAAQCACDGDCACAKACDCSGKDQTTAHWEQIVELTAAASVAEAKLEAREESLAVTADMLEALSAMAADRAGLAARLEAQTEHFKLTEKLLELATENARLKAQVELAEAKAAVMQQTVEMAVENERLKMRIGDLEQHAAEGKAARTAAKPRLEKKAR